jgi:hypothetical protein
MHASSSTAVIPAPSNVIDLAARRALRAAAPETDPPAAPRAATIPASKISNLDDHRPAIDPVTLQLQRCDEALRHIAEQRARLQLKAA